MTRLPPFFALRALEAAARRRSYSRAAEELAVTHGAVSQQIRKLEAELGARLFHRRGNAMEPTPEAERLAGEVARALQILGDGVDAFARASGREPLVLTVGGYMARRWLPPRLPWLMAHPAGAGVQIQVVDRHVDLVAEGVDAGIRYGDGHWRGLEAQRLYSENMFPVCTPELARAQRIETPEDLLRAPLLSARSRPWSIWFDSVCGGAKAPETQWYDDALMLIEAAVRGLGVSLMVEGLVRDELASGRLVRPLGEAGVICIDMFLVWPTDTRKLARIHALRDWLLAEIAKDPPGGLPVS